MSNNTLKLYEEIYNSGYLAFDEEPGEILIEDLINEMSKQDFAEVFGKPVKYFNTIIISDIHLGSKLSRVNSLLQLFKKIEFDRLIINGDIFDSINMRRLSKKHWRLLSMLRKLTSDDKKTEVIWIRGNHDGYSDLLTQLLGITVFDEYLFEWNKKKVLVMHGDVFDVFTSKYPLISNIADIIYKLTIYFDPTNMRISKWLKRNSKAFLRNIQIVRERAAKYAKHRHADIVICGHTHYAEEADINGIKYFNSGSWTTNPSYFIGFTKNDVQLVEFFSSNI
ncbi:phosphodiesterase [bacterium BMS3Abin04]|nr:phosphodiesterase [bacterium BMS3Abin04]